MHHFLMLPWQMKLQCITKAVLCVRALAQQVEKKGEFNSIQAEKYTTAQMLNTTQGLELATQLVVRYRTRTAVTAAVAVTFFLYPV